MGVGSDKLFIEVCGYPLVAHTWWRFDSCPLVDEIVLVTRAGMETSFQSLGDSIHTKKPFRIVPGGTERQNSVSNGLESLSAKVEIVVIQDGARPCTTDALIAATIESAREIGAAVAAQRVTDTLKESMDGKLINRTVDRTHLWAVQTPQVFRTAIIRSALHAIQEKEIKVTDDTAACELAGHPVSLVESVDPNPKATSPDDIPYIQWLLGKSGAGIIAREPGLDQ